MKAIVCCLSDKFETVEYGGRKYAFEHTAWAGWVSCRLDGRGAKNDHPRGAWLALKAKHPEINV